WEPAAVENRSSKLITYVAKATNLCKPVFRKGGRSQSIEIAGPRREKRMFGRVGSSRHNAVWRTQRDGVVVRRDAANAFRSSPVGGFARAFHGVEIAVHPQQQPDQGFPLRLVQAGKQTAFAFERDRDDLVVGGEPLRGERGGGGG